MMKRKRFTKEQIITILREDKAGVNIGDPARRYGISEGVFYNGKASSAAGDNAAFEVRSEAQASVVSDPKKRSAQISNATMA
jgi:hypothetical protein